MRGKKLPRSIHEHFVKDRLELAILRQTEIPLDGRKLDIEGMLPSPGVDFYLSPTKLPRIADARIYKRLIASSKGSWTGSGAQLGGHGSRDGKTNRPHAFDLYLQIFGAAGQGGRERSFCLNSGQSRLNPI